MKLKPNTVVVWAGGRNVIQSVDGKRFTLDSGKVITAEQVCKIECWDHVLGLAWVLNPEEGSAWITKFIRSNDEVDSWLTVFRYCPICGTKLPKIEGQEFL